jgi:hypothetical protein
MHRYAGIYDRDGFGALAGTLFGEGLSGATFAALGSGLAPVRFGGAPSVSSSIGGFEFSGGRPLLLGDAFSPDVVNLRSAEFYSYYGDNPLRGILSNVDARRRYLSQEQSIPSLLDSSLSLSGQARQAFELRNQFRTEARVQMQDRITADRLFREETNLSFEGLYNKTEIKLNNRGVSYPSTDQIYQEIISSSQRSRQSVNRGLGL